MKIALLFAATMALPGGSWSRPAAEIPESVLANLKNMAEHNPKFWERVGNFFEHFKDPGEVVATIHLFDDVHLPLNQEEYEMWGKLIRGASVADGWVKALFPEMHAEMSELDGSTQTKNIQDLIEYIKAAKKDKFHRVSKSIDKDARSALWDMIALQNRINLIFSAHDWQVPPFARERMDKILKRMVDEGEIHLSLPAGGHASLSKRSVDIRIHEPPAAPEHETIDKNVLARSLHADPILWDAPVKVADRPLESRPGDREAIRKAWRKININ